MSRYCQNNCNPLGTSGSQFPTAPIILDPPQDYHDLPITGELTTAHALDHRATTSYKAPSVEDTDDDDDNPAEPRAGTPLLIARELTAGRNSYATYSPYDPDKPDHRGLMIPNTPRLKPTLATKIGQQRITTRQRIKTPDRPLGVYHREVQLEPNENENQDRPDLSDIKILTATSFLQFCRSPGVKAMRFNHNEPEVNTEPPPTVTLPSLSEKGFEDILKGKGDIARAMKAFPDSMSSFIDECFRPCLLRKVTEADIEKFMTSKPEQTQEDILRKLPNWLHDLHDTFLPRLANELPPRRSWDHKIELMPGKNPPYFKNRPLSQPELRVVRKWLDDNLSKGFIRESKAPCAAPLMLAAKPGGGVRVCQDYRGLNNITIKNRYPLPLVRETLDSLGKAKFFTKLDIIAAFNKLRIAEGDEWKTAFITRFGLFETLVTPFGLCNAPSSFQHYINHTLFDILDRFCTAYLDDVLVYSATREEHRNHVREVVRRLRDAGLQIDIDKSEFETSRTTYLGLIITPEGIQMDLAKVTAVRNWKDPPNVRELQRFLGFANFYRRFIKDFSRIAQPLHDLSKKGAPWVWDGVKKEAFEKLKTAFTTNPTLAFFDHNRKTVLETDASDWASGGILSQYDEEGKLPSRLLLSKTLRSRV